MLETINLSVSYGQHRALEEVSIQIRPGEIVVILGANGAGKSTLLKTICGMCKGNQSGSVKMDDTEILGLPPHRIVEQRIALVPEGRGVFDELTVRENLLLGAYSSHARPDQGSNLDRVISLFPKLSERQNQVVHTMSGGEQKMVAIGRAMMSSPVLLMLDEPSLGLSPLLCKELFRILTAVRETGIGILLVEHNAKLSLAIADRGYLLENARIVGENAASSLMNDPAVQMAYLGGAGETEVKIHPAAESTPEQPASIAPSNIPSGGDLPAQPAISISRGHRTSVRADDLLPQNISNLVRNAEKIQSEHVNATRSEVLGTGPPSRSGKKPSDHIARLLAEIEKAAVKARTPEVVQAVPQTPASRKKEPENFDNLPEIEIYRKPKIEIYRRLKPDSGQGPGELVLVKDK